MTALWLGSQESYNELKLGLERAHAAVLAGASEPEDTANTTTTGSVAVVGVSGPLSNSDSFLSWLMGYTSYPSIRNDLIFAMEDNNVASIVLNIDSGGGSPAGLADVSDLIRVIDRVKPVYTYSGGTMASAAYWLGSSARKVYVGPATVAGSIGVISTHMDYSKQLEKDGVTPTVLREGKHKALATPYEPLSDAARASIEAQMASLGDAFVAAVARNRNVSESVVRAKMGGGREFVGQDAVDVGLADGVTTLDALVAQLQRKHTRQEGDMARKTTRMLTPEAVALMQEGVAPELAVQAEVPPVTPETPVTELTTETPPTPDAAPTADPALALELETLRTDLADKDAEIVRLTSELASAQSKLQSVESNHTALRSIALGSIQRLQIGLGAPVLDCSGYPDEAVVQMQASLQAAFSKQFPVGGVVPTTVEEPETEAVTAPNGHRHLQAVRIGKK
jgi:signal peptide peptidase SppA